MQCIRFLTSGTPWADKHKSELPELTILYRKTSGEPRCKLRHRGDLENRGPNDSWPDRYSGSPKTNCPLSTHLSRTKCDLSTLIIFYFFTVLRWSYWEELSLSPIPLGGPRIFQEPQILGVTRSNLHQKRHASQLPPSKLTLRQTLVVHRVVSLSSTGLQGYPTYKKTHPTRTLP